MIYSIGHNIISPLGFTSEDNYRAVLNNSTALRYQEGTFGIPEPFFASIIDEELVNDSFSTIAKGRDSRAYTKFEKMLILSVAQANEMAGINLGSDRVLFILSTTKGNVSLLSNNEDNRVYHWHSAKLLCDFFGNTNEALIVSNACISGAAAQLEALRLLKDGLYDYAVVVGGDVLSKFIVSGFQSFKALSPNICAPFDKNHNGLNLGEAAATIIYSSEYDSSKGIKVALKSAALRNDARHISAPSIEAEGLYNTLNTLLEGVELSDISFVNAHGTATIYNDEMEALALNRMSMQNIPVNSLKAHFGHTLGAAGVLESIISMCALNDHSVIKSRGCITPDDKHEIHPVLKGFNSDKPLFVKMVSGFGGGNAALLFERIDVNKDFNQVEDIRSSNDNLCILSYKKLIINPESNELDSLYRSSGISYPKFFKMDKLCKAGFIASELLLRECGFEPTTPKKNVSIALFNRCSSADDDLLYIERIKDNGAYFPSPSIFVYTLANIVTGEMAIRNKIFGETNFYISEQFSPKLLCQQANIIMKEYGIDYLLCGWCDYFRGKCEVIVFLVTKESTQNCKEKNIIFNNVNIDRLWNS